MDISVTEIVELLDQYNSECYISSKEYEHINEVVLVDGCIKSINPNLLYVCDPQNYKKITHLNSPGNVLLVSPNIEAMSLIENIKLNLIVVNNQEDIGKIYNTICKIFSDHREFNRKKTKLMEALLSCRGLQHIIDVGYKVLGNPMFVSDLAYNILGFNKNVYVVDPSWPTKIESEFESYDRIKALNDSGVFERLYKSSSPCIENFDYSPTRWMACRVAIKEKNVGHIAVVETEKIFDDLDSVLLQFLCTIVASELQKDMVQRSSYKNDFENFFTELIEEKITNSEFIERKKKSLNLKLKANLYVLTINWKTNFKKGMSLGYIKNFVNYLLNTEKSIIYNNKIVVLLSNEKKEPFSEETMTKFTDFINSNGMYAGISQCFNGVFGLNKHYLQSIKAIELGYQLNPQKHLFNYNDYSVYHLMDIVGSQFDLKSFCNPLVFDLMVYDSRYHTNYCDNLQVYILNEGNIAKASKSFQIHRNSMKYRIKKIEEILNISLDDTEIKFSLFMTFKILTYLDENNLPTELIEKNK